MGLRTSRIREVRKKYREERVEEKFRRDLDWDTGAVG